MWLNLNGCSFIELDKFEKKKKKLNYLCCFFSLHMCGVRYQKVKIEFDTQKLSISQYCFVFNWIRFGANERSTDRMNRLKVEFFFTLTSRLVWRLSAFVMCDTRTHISKWKGGCDVIVKPYFQTDFGFFLLSFTHVNIHTMQVFVPTNIQHVSGKGSHNTLQHNVCMEWRHGTSIEMFITLNYDTVTIVRWVVGCVCKISNSPTNSTLT